jgi:hypothetical protein
MDASTPQDLVGEHVPESSYDGLVHEDRLGRAMPRPQGPLEVHGGQVERVGTLYAYDRTHLFVRMSEPQAAELALVAVAELSGTGNEDNASMSMAVLLACSPLKRAGHPEMKDERRPARTDDEPLAMPFALYETPTM